ncbi:acyltransferase family protein [Sulfuriferula sp. GW1]|uniref:acyltransferase family protein n=1 Tax=Sulfuriferula sp. GW1 TaxID=3345111 RepID=UPI0039AF9F1B
MAKRTTIEGIQYLRGIAAMMVVFHHVRHVFGDVSGWTTFGSTGVDIFFVISGFIMVYMTPLSRGTMSERLSDMRRFWLKRVVRIVPLYWIALPLSVVVFKIGLTDPRLINDFLFLPRFNLQFPGEIWPALVPGWSINYEMFFYVIFGLSILFGSQRLLVTAFIITALGIVGGYGQFESAALRFYTSSVIFEFLFGMLLFSLWRYLSTAGLARYRWVWWVSLLGGFVMMAVNLPGPGFLVHGLPAVFIVMGAIFAFEGIHLPSLRVLGDASYSIYLFHLLSFAISWHVVAKLGLSAADPRDLIPVFAIYVVVAAGAGIVLHYLLEMPMVRGGNALIKRFDRAHQAGGLQRATGNAAS